jgi:hypothetical protein
MLVLLFGAANLLANSSMSVGTTAGTPGTTDLVPVSIIVDTNVVSFQFDVLYATNWITPGTPVGGSALADQQLASAVVTQGQFRVLAFSFSNSPITNGVAVYVPFAITNNAPDHDETLVLSNVVLVTAQAESVPVTVVSNATLSVTVPPRFTAIAPTNSGVLHLELTGTTGRVYVIEATTDLVQPQWSALTTNTATNGVAPFDDPSASTFSNRFYRGRFLR